MKRPFRTVYFHDQAGKVASTHGHSCSEKGAVRGAVVRVFVGQHGMARVYREGVALFTIRHNKTGVEVRYGTS